MKNRLSRLICGFVFLFASAFLIGCGDAKPGAVAEKDEISAYLAEHPELSEADKEDAEAEKDYDPNDE